jgi:hypothetical protein
LGFFAYLFFNARRGDVTSIAILAASAAIFLVLIGVAVAIIVQYTTARRDKMQFDQNARENLAIIASIAKTQGIQNQALARQIGQGSNVPALPLPGQDGAWLPALREWEVVDEEPVERHDGQT